MKVRSSHRELLFMKGILPLLCIRYIFHIIVFYRYIRRIPQIGEDLRNECLQEGLDPFDSNMSFLKQIYTVVWGMAYDPFFLTLFYTRLKGEKQFLRIFKPDHSSLYFLKNNIGRNFIMHHPFSTIINARHIGDNCIIKNNTTIGNIHEDNRKCPWIGDNVFIGANVVIFGDIKIGNNVTIGAGSVVNKDIPDNCVVCGNPCRIVSETDGYKGYRDWQNALKRAGKI